MRQNEGGSNGLVLGLVVGGGSMCVLAAAGFVGLMALRSGALTASKQDPPPAVATTPHQQAVAAVKDAPVPTTPVAYTPAPATPPAPAATPVASSPAGSGGYSTGSGFQGYPDEYASIAGKPTVYVDPRYIDPNGSGGPMIFTTPYQPWCPKPDTSWLTGPPYDNGYGGYGPYR